MQESRLNKEQKQEPVRSMGGFSTWLKNRELGVQIISTIEFIRKIATNITLDQLIQESKFD